MAIGLSYDDLQEVMQSHWGSEEFYRHWLARNLIYTEGIKDFVEKAGAVWLVDVVASYMPKIVKENIKKGDWFNLVRVSVKDDNTASFSVKHDKGENAVIRQQIPYTDLPVNKDEEVTTYEFYLIGNGEYYTLLLKSEY